MGRHFEAKDVHADNINNTGNVRRI